APQQGRGVRPPCPRRASPPSSDTLAARAHPPRGGPGPLLFYGLACFDGLHELSCAAAAPGLNQAGSTPTTSTPPPPPPGPAPCPCFSSGTGSTAAVSFGPSVASHSSRRHCRNFSSRPRLASSP